MADLRDTCAELNPEESITAHSPESSSIAASVPETQTHIENGTYPALSFFENLTKRITDIELALEAVVQRESGCISLRAVSTSAEDVLPYCDDVPQYSCASRCQMVWHVDAQCVQQVNSKKVYILFCFHFLLFLRFVCVLAC